MMTAVNDGDSGIRLFYTSTCFAEDVNVAGYAIYLDLQKSDEYAFDELGDGVYTTIIPIRKAGNSSSEKFGFLIKENGVPKKFETVLVVF